MSDFTPHNILREADKSVKQKANETEKKLAKKLGGCRRPMSGAIGGLKGDVSTDTFLFDSKETIDSSIRVRLDDLFKISKEANAEGKHPALVLSLKGQQWVCIPLDVFKEMQ